MKRRLAIPVLLVLACALPAAAHANGDPASDVLPFSNVFLSVQNPKGFGAGRELLALTADAKKKKYPIKVAVIAEPGDLGLIQSMWRKPQTYANFLGRELIQFARYRGTLIVAMPDGFGVFGPGATPGGTRALRQLAKPGTAELGRLGDAAALAVRRVAASNGHPVSAPSGGSGMPGWVIVLAVLGGLALAGGAAFYGLRRWLTGTG